jgi:5'-nucleotidase
VPDFDFGLEALGSLMRSCNFEWLMSNVYDKATGLPLANGLVTRLFDWSGHKIGLVGLVEEEWMATLGTISMEDVEFRDFVEEGRRLANQLRAEGAEMVIALTHMRQPNDEKLTSQVPEIDLVLGGHDHHYECKQIKGRWLCKSGTDFREFTKLTVRFADGKIDVSAPERVEVDSKVEEDESVKRLVDKYQANFKEKMEIEIGHTAVDLDGRFSSIRTKETNLGNFVADLMRLSTEADFAVLNSGTLRSDDIHLAGPLKMKDLVAVLPMADTLVVLGIRGDQVIDVLENGVSQWPKMEGRFPQVSGVCFEFDGSKPSGSRVNRASIQIGGSDLDMEREYKLVTKEYLSLGKDGYDVLKSCKVLVDGESAPVLPSVVRNHFTELATKNGYNAKKFVSRRGSAIVLNNNQADAGLKIADMNRKAASGQKLAGISPMVEGRIVQKELHKLPEGNEVDTASTASTDSIVILHFNDVYNIEPRDKEPVGGAARFATQLRQVGGRDALILFSGDAFNPSMMSTVLKGKQMVPCLNEMNIHTAVLGNHGNCAQATDL